MPADTTAFGKGNVWGMLRESVNRGLNALGPFPRNSGLGTVGNAKMTYDFTVDGGAIGTIVPVKSPIIPANAIILGGVIDTTLAPTSGGAATIALGLGAGAQVAVLKAATPIASYVLGNGLTLIPIFTAATYVEATVAAQLTLTVAAFTLTGGKLSVNVVYLQGNA